MDNNKLAHTTIFFSGILLMVISFLMFYPLLTYYGVTNEISNYVFGGLSKVDVIKRPYVSKGLLMMFISGAVMLYYPKKKDGITVKSALLNTTIGVVLLLASDFVISSTLHSFWFSMVMLFLGFGFYIYGMTQVFQIMNFKDLSKDDPFNDDAETFQQTEVEIQTEYSVNIPYEYYFEGKMREGWINFINLFRALLVIGTPGSGKSFAVIEEIINQFIRKNFALCIYDFKRDTLTKVAYNYYQNYKEEIKDDKKALAMLPTFRFISFDNIEKSHRCNPIDPYLMSSQSDATDAAATIMKNLNREWIKKTDFFSKSAISLVSGLIWYLKVKSEERGEQICTLPHVVILSTVRVEYLLDIMLKVQDVRTLMTPFKDAHEGGAVKQLAGQTGTAQLSLGELSDRQMFYIMSGNDFMLDINNPKRPVILSVQNNADRDQVYSGPIGLYINKVMQVCNKPDKRHLGLIIDELPTIFLMGLRKVIDTGRSNKIATILGIQSFGQMVQDYSKELAEVIFDNCANIICGSAKGETAKKVSAIFGKIHQKKSAKTISKNDTSTNISTQMMELLPQSKIAAMSTGKFAGLVADTFENRIEQKLCYGGLKPDIKAKKGGDTIDLPIINSFETPQTESNKKTILANLERYKFYKYLALIDPDQTNYIVFYHEYINDFAAQEIDEYTQAKNFVKYVKYLKVFEHLDVILDLRENVITMDAFKQYFIDLVSYSIVEKNKQKAIDDNFMKIIQDIDRLVNSEYEKIHNKSPEHKIFDPQKSDNVDRSISEVRSNRVDVASIDTKSDIPKFFAKNLESEQDRSEFHKKYQTKFTIDNNDEDYYHIQAITERNNMLAEEDQYPISNGIEPSENQKRLLNTFIDTVEGTSDDSSLIDDSQKGHSDSNNLDSDYQDDEDQDDDEDDETNIDGADIPVNKFRSMLPDLNEARKKMDDQLFSDN